MRLSDRIRLRSTRKTALKNIADYYIAVERQARQPQPDAMPYTVVAPGSRVSPADHPATNFDPMATYPPPPPIMATTEPDPGMRQTVDLLANELDREVNLPPRVNDSRDAQLSAIKRRVRI